MLAAALWLVLVPAVSTAAEARRDSVLAWDDGQYNLLGDYIGARPGQMLAVRFEAPSWARSVVGISFYIMQSIDTFPTEFPPPDTACFFLARVWSPDPDDPSMPGQARYYPVATAGAIPVYTWLDLTLPEPVDISDPVLFPDGAFFVGLQWVPCGYCALIGLDADQPVDLMTRRYRSGQWTSVVGSDAMIHVRVSDQPGTPVAQGSWSSIKSLYRQGARLAN